jgi:hypothetical protein
MIKRDVVTNTTFIAWGGCGEADKNFRCLLKVSKQRQFVLLLKLGWTEDSELGS